MLDVFVVSGILGWIFYSDYTQRIIPNLAVFGILLAAAIKHYQDPAPALIGLVVMAAAFFIPTVVGLYGAGDWKLGAALGAYLGLPLTVVVFAIASVLAVCWSLMVWLRNRKTSLWKITTPFGCWLAIGFWVVAAISVIFA